MNAQSIITNVLAGLYVFALIFSVFAMIYFKIRLEKARGELKNKINKKLDANIKLTPDDLVNIGKGMNLNRVSVGKCLSQLLADEADSHRFIEIRRLISEMERAEPFDELPEEVKPSLLRLGELMETSTVKSDQLILAPIQKTLASYVELKDEVAKGRKLGYFMNALAVLGFIIGAWGVYLTSKSPDSRDIDTIVRRAISAASISGEIQENKEGPKSRPTIDKTP